MLPGLLGIALVALGSAWAIDTELTEFRWRGSVEPCGIVAVRNRLGNVRTYVMPGRGREVEVVARKRTLGGDLDSISIEVVQKGDGVEIIAFAPANTAPIEVDLTVSIPAGIRLKVERP